MPWLAAMDVIRGQRGPDGAPGVPGCRLYPDTVEDPGPVQLTIGDAVQRNAAGKANVPQTGLFRYGPAKSKDDFFGDRLNRRGDVHVKLREQLFRLPGGLAEQPIEAAVGHGQAGTVVEIALIQAKRTVLLQVDQMVVDEAGEPGLSVGRKPHELVLAGIDLEAGVIREGRVEKAEGMREMNLTLDLDARAAPDGHRGRRPLADAVHRENGRFLERRGEERAGRMR